LFLIPLFLVGFAGVLFGTAPETPDSIMPHIVLSTGLPALVVGLVCAGGLAASMSTGDGLLHGAAPSAVEDGLLPCVKLNDAQRRFLMRALVVGVGTLAYYLAIVQRKSLVGLLLMGYGLIDQLAPPVYAALFWRRATTPGVLAGLGAGIATNVFFLVQADLRPFDIHEGILGMIVNAVVLVA